MKTMFLMLRYRQKFRRCLGINRAKIDSLGSHNMRRYGCFHAAGCRQRLHGRLRHKRVGNVMFEGQRDRGWSSGEMHTDGIRNATAVLNHQSQ